MSSQKSTAGRSTMAEILFCQMAHGQKPWSTGTLARITHIAPTEPRYPAALGLLHWEQGNAREAVTNLREARKRLLFRLETRPSESDLTELTKLERDLAEAEAALS